MLGDTLDTVTLLHPLGLVALGIMSLIVLTVKREIALMPLIVMAMLIPSGQRLVVGSIDFTLLRLMLIVAWTRLALRGELQGMRLRSLDVAMIGWAISTTVVYTLQRGDVSALINRLGASFDALGVYFYARATVRNLDDVEAVVRSICLLSLVLAGFFVFETMTGINPFGYLGGTRTVTGIWDGSPRLQGAFPHPILAGAFFAALVPYALYGVTRRGLTRLLGWVATASLVFIVFAARSSTSFVAVMVAGFGMILYRYRYYMRQMRVLTFLGLFVLHFFLMNNPVWHLVTYIDFRAGSTGWHRFRLIDSAINRVGEWWLLGSSNITHWNIWANDVTNQYIVEGLRGGLAALAAFIAMIVIAFSKVGQGVRALESHGNRRHAILLWSLGVSVAVHAFSFLGVSYFGQTYFGWHLSLALVACATGGLETAPLRVSRLAEA